MVKTKGYEPEETVICPCCGATVPYEVITLDSNQVKDIENKLDAYDKAHIKYTIDGEISLGIVKDLHLIAGVNACMTAYHILYVSTLFVEKPYRNKGVGTFLMNKLENEAKKLGANLIRLDSFNWQGAHFYEKIGYKKVGEYRSEKDLFSEYFFLKEI